MVNTIWFALVILGVCFASRPLSSCLMPRRWPSRGLFSRAGVVPALPRNTHDRTSGVPPINGIVEDRFGRAHFGIVLGATPIVLAEGENGVMRCYRVDIWRDRSHVAIEVVPTEHLAANHAVVPAVNRDFDDVRKALVVIPVGLNVERDGMVVFGVAPIGAGEADSLCPQDFQDIRAVTQATVVAPRPGDAGTLYPKMCAQESRGLVYFLADLRQGRAPYEAGRLAVVDVDR